jgi:hypothetical protein
MPTFEQTPSATSGQPFTATNPREKAYCHSIPAIVGPWRGKIRAWHQPRRRDGLDQMFGTASGATVPVPMARERGSSCAVQHPDRSIARLCVALRRERQLGRGGGIGYSIERHSALSRAVHEALGRAHRDAASRAAGERLH